MNKYNNIHTLFLKREGYDVSSHETAEFIKWIERMKEINSYNPIR